MPFGISNCTGVDNDCQDILQRLRLRKFYSLDFARQVWQYDEKTAMALWSCGSEVSIQNDGIVASNFCRSRWCPTCQWRRSRLLWQQNNVVLQELLVRGSYRFVLLTLTIPNVPLSELGTALHDMAAAWNRMKSNRAFKKLGILGGLRTTEVTYNALRDDWHPHFHVCFVLPARGVWLPDRDWWLDIWRTSMRDSSITQVDIRTVKADSNGELSGALDEISKYVVKSKDILKGFDFSQFDLLKAALHGLRFYSPFGVWRDIRRELRLKDVDAASLVDDVSGAAPIEDYRWDYKLQDFFKVGVTTAV